MTSRWEKRIIHELAAERKLLLLKQPSKLNGVTFSLHSLDEIPKSFDTDVNNEDLSIFSKLSGYIRGPPDTPYENGVFHITIEIPFNYPLVPPKMKFLTIPYHPNVSSQTGAICVDILKTEWSPMLTLRKALMSLQILLQCPNPNDPQDHIVADQYLNSTHDWEATAKLWTKERALNVNWINNLPVVPETNVCIECQNKAMQKYNKIYNNHQSSSLDVAVGGNTGREDCTLCQIQ